MVYEVLPDLDLVPPSSSSPLPPPPPGVTPTTLSLTLGFSTGLFLWLLGLISFFLSQGPCTSHFLFTGALPPFFYLANLPPPTPALFNEFMA